MLPAEALAKLDAMDDYDRMLAFSRFGSDYRMSAAEVEAQYNAWKSGDTVAPSTFTKTCLLYTSDAADE